MCQAEGGLCRECERIVVGKNEFEDSQLDKRSAPRPPPVTSDSPPDVSHSWFPVPSLLGRGKPAQRTSVPGPPSHVARRLGASQTKARRARKNRTSAPARGKFNPESTHSPTLQPKSPATPVSLFPPRAPFPPAQPSPSSKH
ncbi:hypothetical protein CDV31_005858 [Fusarium ambrosium]|uniref:Uncharacterized protein n=1 Tax=Fusarium ambrosium TaxID=131363 RepID=A0A428UGL2_9HYPO|nr:hypothetical protein CDV31_005858 [Fusarium ambrosium]